jgi:hypothetical protein
MHGEVCPRPAFYSSDTFFTETKLVIIHDEKTKEITAVLVVYKW